LVDELVGLHGVVVKESALFDARLACEVGDRVGARVAPADLLRIFLVGVLSVGDQ
jgi:hypothetical protein